MQQYMELFMSIETYLLFIAGMFAFCAMPGADFFYVLSRALGGGAKTGIYAAVGIATGVLFHTFLAVVGLSALLLSSATAFMVIKYIGAAYLCYIGFKMFTAKGGFGQVETTNRTSDIKVFRQGILTNALNPKVCLTFVAFIPQFLTPETSSPLMLGMLGITTAIIALLWFTCVAVFAAKFRTVIAESKAFSNLLKYGLSSLLMGFGAKLAMTN
ncbi:LysE family translocator [Aliivibrio fischeri]|uniref:LysE family translocator n=3 Tax=Aliivibrio fischeri TaxID=668 RepID=A0A844P8C3_ALIFS|nr:LysE family translocator [Aliivibrio fischeri]MUK50468.1 LysE family translocator [Aliivibrio fischeri]MUK61938.1 LysE family translocator [Aliivibrio fischeri]MUK64072.1 LysE family translocator [Aliivibrio fischeri]MUK69375.1 LysE family translocator [Aliivibrio fischeri]